MSQPLFDETGKPLKTDGGDEFSSPAYYAEPPQKQRGCFFYGCIFAAIGMGLMLLVILGLAGTGLYFANQLINQYTSETPATIPQVSLSDAEKAAAKDRFDAFKKAVDDGAGGEIVLTADDINALIDREPELKGKVFIKIKGEEITGEISMPLDIPGKGKRYLNGNGTITIELTDGDLDVRIRDLEVNGKKLPPDVKAQLGGENIAKDFSRNPENAKLIRQIESIKVADSKVHIKARAKTSGEDGATTPAPAPSAGDDSAKPKTEAAPKKDETPAPAPKEKEEAKPKTKASAERDGRPTGVRLLVA